MARDGWLPDKIASIHRKRRTPHVAIMATAVIFLIVSVALPVKELGSAASVMFLLVFAMVNLSLIALRRKQPDLKRPFRIPLYPVTPILYVLSTLAVLVLLAQRGDLSVWVALLWFAGVLGVHRWLGARRAA